MGAITKGPSHAQLRRSKGRRGCITGDRKGRPRQGPAEGLKAITVQVLGGSRTREHMVGIGLIPLSGLVTEGASVLGWGWELPWISHALLG